MLIRIISSSVRTGRKSDRLALFFKNYITEHQLGDCEILDLEDFDFPLFEERLRFQKNPLPGAREFATKIATADAIIVVSPEYNGSIPASLKNAIDLLGKEWKRKTIGLVTVSAGQFGGSQALISLQFILWKLGAVPVPAIFPVSHVEKQFDEKGRPTEAEETNKHAELFMNEILFFARALKS